MTKLNTKRKLTYIGTVLYYSALSTVLSFGHLSAFLISYYKNFHKEISYEHGFFLMPFFTITLSLSNLIEPHMEKLLGFYFTMIFSGILVLSAPCLLAFSKSLYLLYGIMMLFGLGFGTGGLCSIKNVSLFNPNSKSISTYISAKGLLVGIIFTTLGYLVVNRFTFGPFERGYFSYTISKNLKKFVSILIFFVIYTLIISLILISSHKKKNEEEEKQPSREFIEELSDVVSKDNKILLEVAIVGGANFPIIKKEKRVEVSSQVFYFEFKQTLFSWRFLGVFVLYFLSVFPEEMFFNTFIFYFNLNIKEKNSSVNFSFFQSLGQSIIIPVFQVLLSKFLPTLSFKRALLMKSVISSVICFCIGYPFSTVNIVNIKFIIAFMLGITFSLATGTALTHLKKVFSQTYGIFLYGILCMAECLSGLAGAGASFLIVQSCEMNKLNNYKIIYYLGSAVNIVVMFLSFFEDEKEFIFKPDYNKI